MTIENQNAYLIQLAVSVSLSAIHLELTEMMDYHGKAKCTFASASSFIRSLSVINLRLSGSMDGHFIQQAVACSLSSLYLELMEIIDDSGKEKSIFDSAISSM